MQKWEYLILEQTVASQHDDGKQTATFTKYKPPHGDPENMGMHNWPDYKLLSEFLNRLGVQQRWELVGVQHESSGVWAYLFKRSKSE